ncbi:hypothetical protein OF897_08865 [Chryseobacterium formosus]|uniref:Uncharacterized protein n=1 Tax=Chryseobacterium formosus TaxID=1537363 RepID=A0ABT3XTT9_9FLAO|nr:hypothetical protein [Chryseobacterium formosus]MCX8524034.1 hypothetical protein [Chryseobacterium formosus]
MSVTEKGSSIFDKNMQFSNVVGKNFSTVSVMLISVFVSGTFSNVLNDLSYKAPSLDA